MLDIKLVSEKVKYNRTPGDDEVSANKTKAVRAIQMQWVYRIIRKIWSSNG
jgi:hypothetical protein